MNYNFQSDDKGSKVLTFKAKGKDCKHSGEGIYLVNADIVSATGIIYDGVIALAKNDGGEHCGTFILLKDRIVSLGSKTFYKELGVKENDFIPFSYRVRKELPFDNHHIDDEGWSLGTSEEVKELFSNKKVGTIKTAQYAQQKGALKMAKSTIDVKGIEKNIQAGDIFLMDGKKQIVVDDYEVKKAGVVIDFRNVGKEGKLSNKEQNAEITSAYELIPIKGKLVTTVTATEAAVNRAMKEWMKANGNADTGKSSKAGKKASKSDDKAVKREMKKAFSTMLKNLKTIVKSDDKDEIKEAKAENRKLVKAINKAGFSLQEEDGEIALLDGDEEEVATRKLPAAKADKKAGKTSAKAGKKADKPKKVYALLKKEKKVVTAKALKKTKSGAKCAFKLDGETEERSIKSEFIFEDRTDAKAALKELKGGGKKASSKKTDKKADKKKADKPKKVYVAAKKKVLAGKLVKELSSGKLKIEFKDSDGDKVLKSFKPEVVFESKAEAKKALKGTDKKAGKKSSKKAASKKEELTCGQCKFRNAKTNECKWYNDVFADSEICEDGHFKAKK